MKPPRHSCFHIDNYDGLCPNVSHSTQLARASNNKLSSCSTHYNAFLSHPEKPPYIARLHGQKESRVKSCFIVLQDACSTKTRNPGTWWRNQVMVNILQCKTRVLPPGSCHWPYEMKWNHHFDETANQNCLNLLRPCFISLLWNYICFSR